MAVGYADAATPAARHRPRSRWAIKRAQARPWAAHMVAPTALSASLRRRPGPSASARRNHAVRRPTSLVWRSPVGITSKSTHSSKQRPAAVHHLISRSPAQLQRSLRPALKRAAVNTRQSRAGPRRCDRVHQHPHLCDRHRPTFLRTRYCVDLTASPIMRPPAGWGQLPGCLRLHEPVAA